MGTQKVPKAGIHIWENPSPLWKNSMCVYLRTWPTLKLESICSTQCHTLFWAFQKTKICDLSKKSPSFEQPKKQVLVNLKCFLTLRFLHELFKLFYGLYHPPLRYNLGPPCTSLLGHIIFCIFMECSVYILKSPWVKMRQTFLFCHCRRKNRRWDWI